MKIILSIVIPVYNVAKYIPDCLQNIINKHPEEVEIILVDDGSTDSSGEVIDRYALEYMNVNAYHKKNGGLSDARNYGLMKASGKYVFFYDSDDFVTDTFLEEIFGVLDDEIIDVLLWDADVYDEYGKKTNIDSSYYHHNGLENNGIYTGQEVIQNQLLDHNNYVTTVWLGAYSRSFLLDNNLWFEKGLLHEDELWTQKVLLHSKRVKYLKKEFYCYRKRINSIMNPAEKDWSRNIEALIYSFSTLPTYYDFVVKDQSFKKMLKGNTTKRYLHMIGKYRLSRYPELINRVNRKQLIIDANTKKDKIRAIILYFNINLYCWLMNYIKR